MAATPSKAIVFVFITLIFLMLAFHLEFFFLQTNSPDFTVDKNVTASPGYRQPSEAAVSVCFEPHQLGEAKGLLTLSSDIGGQYTFVLRGTCIPPQAQGPFTIKPGRSLNIPFKNVFLHTTTYSVQVKKIANQVELPTSKKIYIYVYIYICISDLLLYQYYIWMWPVLL